MKAPVYPLSQVERLRRSLVAKGVPQVVFVRRRGGLDFAQAGGLRHRFLELDPGFSRRVAGVFDGSASLALLAASIRGISQ